MLFWFLLKLCCILLLILHSILIITSILLNFQFLRWCVWGWLLSAPRQTLGVRIAFALTLVSLDRKLHFTGQIVIMSNLFILCWFVRLRFVDIGVAFGRIFVVFVLVVTIIKVFIDVRVLNLVMAIFSSVIITVNYAKLLNIDRISPRNSICAVMTWNSLLSSCLF